MSELGGFEPPSGPPAGWYPDPNDPGRQRYWNGRAWDLSTTITAERFAAGDGDDLPTVGDWLDVGFRSAYRRWRAVAILAVLTAPASTALTYVAIDRTVDGLVIDGDHLYGWTNDRLPGVIALILAATLIGLVGTIAVSVLMLRTIDGDGAGARSTPGELKAAIGALAEAGRVLPRAIGWGLVLVAGAAVLAGLAILAAFASASLSVLVLLVAGPVLIWLGVKWAFLVVAVIDRPGNPFRRSSVVSDGRWWRTLGRLILLAIIVWLISAAVQTAVSLLSGTGWGGLGNDLQLRVDENGRIERFVFDEELRITTREIVMAAVGSVVTTVLASSVIAAATAVLYRTRNRRP